MGPGAGDRYDRSAMRPRATPPHAPATTRRAAASPRRRAVVAVLAAMSLVVVSVGAGAVTSPAGAQDDTGGDDDTGTLGTDDTGAVGGGTDDGDAGSGRGGGLEGGDARRKGRATAPPDRSPTSTPSARCWRASARRRRPRSRPSPTSASTARGRSPSTPPASRWSTCAPTGRWCWSGPHRRRPPGAGHGRRPRRGRARAGGRLGRHGKAGVLRGGGHRGPGGGHLHPAPLAGAGDVPRPPARGPAGQHPQDGEHRRRGGGHLRRPLRAVDHRRAVVPGGPGDGGGVRDPRDLGPLHPFRGQRGRGLARADDPVPGRPGLRPRRVLRRRCGPVQGPARAGVHRPGRPGTDQACRRRVHLRAGGQPGRDPGRVRRRSRLQPPDAGVRGRRPGVRHHPPRRPADHDVRDGAAQLDRGRQVRHLPPAARPSVASSSAPGPRSSSSPTPGGCWTGPRRSPWPPSVGR